MIVWTSLACWVFSAAIPFVAAQERTAARRIVEALPEFDRSVPAVNRANALFDRVVETYRNAPAIRDHTTVRTIAIPRGSQPEQTFEVPIIISRDGVKITLHRITMTAIDGTMYGEFDEKPERLFVQDFDGPLTADLFTTQMSVFPFPHFPFVLSRDPLEEIFFFTFDTRIVGHRVVTVGEEEFEEIRIESATEGAPVMLRIDPRTNLVVRFEAQMRNLDNPDRGMDVVTEMRPEILDEFPYEEFDVTVEGRKMIASLPGLVGPPQTGDLVDEVAPEFEFATLDGESISSDDLEGHVVVLTFWTIASEFMTPVLDHLLALREWVEEEEIGARVLLVNAGDQEEDLRFHIAHRQIEVPIRIDERGMIGIREFKAPIFPTTVVIGADGTIRAALVAERTTLEALMSAVRAAVERGV